jgi:predicted dinucleotide-binding enzyme
MTIGIVGSDDRALAIARLLRHGGHRISFSDPRAPGHARRAAQAFGDDQTASTPYQQARSSDALVLAVRWEEVDQALTGLGDYKDGILIDATRAPHLERGLSGAELLAHKLDNRHIVKAFVDPPESKGVVKICGDDPEARDAVKALIESAGAVAEDLGPLKAAAELERESR